MYYCNSILCFNIWKSSNYKCCNIPSCKHVWIAYSCILVHTSRRALYFSLSRLSSLDTESVLRPLTHRQDSYIFMEWDYIVFLIMVLLCTCVMAKVELYLLIMCKICLTCVVLIMWQITSLDVYLQTLTTLWLIDWWIDNTGTPTESG